MTKHYVDQLAHYAIGSAIKVHSELGPGLLESVYRKCLAHVLQQKGLHVEQEARVPLYFEGFLLEERLRMDLLIENQLVIEVKAVENMHPLYEAQLLTYLKLSEKPKGLLINFNCNRIMEHLVSRVSETYAQLPAK